MCSAYDLAESGPERDVIGGAGGIVLGVVLDGGEGGLAGGPGGAEVRAVLVARAQKIDDVRNLRDALDRQGNDLFGEGFGVGGRRGTRLLQADRATGLVGALGTVALAALATVASNRMRPPRSSRQATP